MILQNLHSETDLKVNASKIKRGFVHAQIYSLCNSAKTCYKSQSLFSKAFGYAHFCFSSQSKKASHIGRKRNHHNVQHRPSNVLANFTLQTTPWSFKYHNRLL